MKISIIAAMDEKRGIGKDNKIPWHIKEDFKRFKALTSGHPIIMGRKTWDSLPTKPLPNRTNIVVTRDVSFSLARRRLARLAGSLEEAIKIAKEILKQVQAFGSETQVIQTLTSLQTRRARRDDTEKEVFIIGGGQIFEQALPLADKLYLTIVEGDFGADAFFPDYSEFKKVVFEQKGESEGHKYTFLELER